MDACIPANSRTDLKRFTKKNPNQSEQKAHPRKVCRVDFKIPFWWSWKELDERTSLKDWSLHWSMLFGNRGWVWNIARTAAIGKSILPDFKIVINHSFAYIIPTFFIKTYTSKVRAICHGAKTYGSPRWLIGRIYSITPFTWNSYSWIWLSPKWPVVMSQRKQQYSKRRQPIIICFIFFRMYFSQTVCLRKNLKLIPASPLFLYYLLNLVFILIPFFSFY